MKGADKSSVNGRYAEDGSEISGKPKYKQVDKERVTEVRVLFIFMKYRSSIFEFCSFVCMLLLFLGRFSCSSQKTTVSTGLWKHCRWVATRLSISLPAHGD